MDVEKLEALYTVVGIVKWYRHSGKKYDVFSKKNLNRNAIWSSNPTSGYIFERIEIRILKRYLQSHVHCSIIYNSQVVVTTETSIDKWMNKENVVHTFNGILLSPKKEENVAIYDNMGEPGGYYGK